MTDYPRFQKPEGEPDTIHRAYYGGRLVDLVLRLADWWTTTPGTRCASADGTFKVDECLPTIAPHAAAKRPSRPYLDEVDERGPGSRAA